MPLDWTQNHISWKSVPQELQELLGMIACCLLPVPLPSLLPFPEGTWRVWLNWFLMAIMPPTTTADFAWLARARMWRVSSKLSSLTTPFRFAPGMERGTAVDPVAIRRRSYLNSSCSSCGTDFQLMWFWGSSRVAIPFTYFIYYSVFQSFLEINGKLVSQEFRHSSNTQSPGVSKNRGGRLPQG